MHYSIFTLSKVAPDTRTPVYKLVISHEQVVGKFWRMAYINVCMLCFLLIDVSKNVFSACQVCSVFSRTKAFWTSKKPKKPIRKSTHFQVFKKSFFIFEIFSIFAEKFSKMGKVCREFFVLERKWKTLETTRKRALPAENRWTRNVYYNIMIINFWAFLGCPCPCASYAICVFKSDFCIHGVH